MASQKWIVCRLCLKIQDNVDEFKAIEDDMKDILDKVLQNMDFASVQNPVMCTNCADTLLKCFDFKAKCNSDYIAPYMNKQDDVKLNLIDVYSKSENGTGVLEVRDVCGLCRSPLKNSSVLTVVIEGDIALTKMIEQCVPEVDRNSIKKSVICLQCQGSLENCFRFLTDCLMVEDKIKKYCERLDIDSNGGMDQSRLLQLATMNFTGEVDGSSTDLIKVKDEFCEGIENADETGIANGSDVFEFNQVFCNDREEKIDLKRESFMDVDELKFGNEECFTSKNVVKLEEPFFEENVLKEEDLVEMKDQKCVLNEEVEIKTDESDFNSLEDGILRQPKLTKDDLKINLLMHKDPLGVTLYRCDSCLFQTKRKNQMERHWSSHKDPSEVTMHKCVSCSFQTKHKNSLNRHLLTHKDPSELTLYKCDSCSFETKRKAHLLRHLLKHKDPSEVRMYKCASCSFQSKHKRDLTKHLLKHKYRSEETMYKCDFCLFQTIRKDHMKMHLLTHRDPSNITMYKCNSCPYQSECKKKFKRHFVKHKDLSEITKYKCESCMYWTICKSDLKKHSVKHKDPSDVTMYRCETCPYQTKYRTTLKNHLLKHKHPLEVKLYQCDSCLYQTIRKEHLKRHLLKHRDPFKVTMYKCESCPFRTKDKYYLNTHRLKHKDPSEVKLYQCDSCSYQTVQKRYLKNHLLKHKDPSATT